MKTKTEDRPQGTLSFMLQVEEMPLKVMTIIKKVEEQEEFGVREAKEVECPKGQSG